MSLTDLEDESSTALAANPDNAAIELAAHWNGPSCEKCSAPVKAGIVTVCRQCGWYPSLNQFIEVDQDWEAICGEEGQAAPRPKQSHIEVWMHLLPWWAWVIIASLAAVVAESVAVHLLTAANSGLRTSWSIAQLAIGTFLFIGLHCFNFVVAASEDSDVGMLDVFIKPLGLWIRAFKKLPYRLWVVDGAAVGLMAVTMSILVIGGLPYDRLWDWGGKPKKANLLGAMVKQAQKLPGSGSDQSIAEAVGGIPEENGNGPDSLEEAVGKLTEEANNDGDGTSSSGDEGKGADSADDSDGKSSKDGKPGKGGEDSAENGEESPDDNDQPIPPADDAERPTTTCVILGYRLGADGNIRSLVLGAAPEGKLVYAGTVDPPADDPKVHALAAQLAATHVKEPYLPLYISATWVRPKFACEVSYHQRERDGRLIDVRWIRLLGQLPAKSGN